MIWGFVDYENTGSLTGFSTKDYERIFVFCGPTNNKINLGELPSTEFSRIECIGIKTTGTNNLDFHLAFYLGRLHESAKENVEFHIISNDTGFNGLLSHLKKIGRKCKRIPTRKSTNTKKANSKKNTIALSVCGTLVATRLNKMDNKKRPVKKDKLLNWIKSQCGHKKPVVSSEKIYEELKATGNIKASTSGITYDLKC